MTDTPPSPPASPPAPGPRPSWQRNLPNALTLARVLMTVAFVAVLSIYQFPDTNSWALPVALVLFVVAALTDAADGYLARRWQVVSVFGRIMDPFADKILILGAFVMLAGPQFWVDQSFEFGERWTGQVSGVATWMVVVILGRELMVTTIRAVLEGRGVDFSAQWTGKAKMIVQSVAVPAILFFAHEAHKWHGDLVVFDASLPLEKYKVWLGMGVRMAYFNSVIAWAATLITAASAIPYITRAISALRKPTHG